MGQNQSHQIAPAKTGIKEDFSDNDNKSNSNSTSNTTTINDDGEMPLYPDPQGSEDDPIDQLQSELPSMIDSESQQQVDDYIQACDNGKGPMVACFAQGEYLSMFQRKHDAAFELFENTCYRPKTDKSPNGKEVDGTKAYGPACFNMAKMLMTGKGGVEANRRKAYDVFDRGCKTGHGGACHIQAKMLLSPPGALGKDIPYDPFQAMDLYQQVCDTGDSISCFTLATMLLRGDKINKLARNATPQEIRGEEPVAKRENEDDRGRGTAEDHEKELYIPRDPKRAEQLLMNGCATGAHAPSCFNLAVMYENGDDGVPVNTDKAEEYKKRTETIINTFGGFGN